MWLGRLVHTQKARVRIPAPAPPGLECYLIQLKKTFLDTSEATLDRFNHTRKTPWDKNERSLTRSGLRHPGVVYGHNPPMDRRLNPRPSVPSSCGALDHGGGQVSNTAEGAKNHWIRTGRHWNLNLATFNTRTLSSEGSLAVLLEELADVKWDIIGLSEIRRTGEAFKVLDSGHILCYRGLPDRKQHGVGFLIHKEIAGNVEEFYSVSERVAAVVVKLNRRYKLKVVQAYAPTASYDDEAVDSFYEGIESAMNKVSTQYSVIMGDFNAKVGQKQVGERAVGSYGIGTRNSRGDTLVNFAEKNKLRVMNTFFNKRKNRK